MLKQKILIVNQAKKSSLISYPKLTQKTLGYQSTKSSSR